MEPAAREWPLAVDSGAVPRLAACIAHEELAVTHVSGDTQRPRFHCRVARRVAHGAFAGHNRAKSAVIEACILASRLHMLPRQKVESEMAYLQIAIGKTAGPEELEAWGWVKAKIDGHLAAPAN